MVESFKSFTAYLNYFHSLYSLPVASLENQLWYCRTTAD